MTTQPSRVPGIPRTPVSPHAAKVLRAALEVTPDA